MPYLSEKLVKLQGTMLDRRRKLTDEQKDEISSLKGVLSARKCAEKYNVSKRTIQFIWDPDKLKESLKRRKERGGSSIYYDRESHNESIRNMRRYKQKLFLGGLNE